MEQCSRKSRHTLHWILQGRRIPPYSTTLNGIKAKSGTVDIVCGLRSSLSPSQHLRNCHLPHTIYKVSMNGRDRGLPQLCAAALPDFTWLQYQTFHEYANQIKLVHTCILFTLKLFSLEVCTLLPVFFHELVQFQQWFRWNVLKYVKSSVL